MKNPLLIVILILLFLWILLCSVLFKKNCGCTHEAAAVPAVIAPVEGEEEAISIAIEDGVNSFSRSATDNLLFAANSCDYIEPLSDRLTTVFEETATYLQDNADRMLLLTGLSENTESNDCTDAADLGYARAEKVKSLLIGMGAPEGQIRLGSTFADMDRHTDKMLGGVRYDFIGGGVDDVEERLRMGNITLYFETSESNLSLDSDQQRYFEDLKYYISQKSDGKISITGHTDNEGDYDSNKTLSRGRARFVREYLVENGIPKENIKIEGLGSDQPIDTNDTDEGRAKNRRVEVTIQ